MTLKKIGLIFLALVLLVSAFVVSPVSADTSVSELDQKELELAELEKALKAIDPNIKLIDASELPEGTEMVEMNSNFEILNTTKQVADLNNHAVMDEVEAPSVEEPILKEISHDPVFTTNVTWRYDSFVRKAWYDAAFQFRRISYQYYDISGKIKKVKNIKADYVGAVAGTYHHRHSTYSITNNGKTVGFKIYGDYVLGVVVKGTPIGIVIPQNWSYGTTPRL